MKVKAYGKPEEWEKITKALTYDFEVEVKESGQNCSSNWDLITSIVLPSNFEQGKYYVNYAKTLAGGKDASLHSLSTVVDKSGNMYVLMTFVNTLVLNNNTTLINQDVKRDAVLIKYNRAGNLLWHRQYKIDYINIPSQPQGDNVGGILDLSINEDFLVVSLQFSSSASSADDEVINYGIRINDVVFDSNTPRGKYTLVEKISDKGSVIWGRKGINTSTSIYIDPIFGVDNNLIFTGFINAGIGKQDISFVKLSSLNGNVIEDYRIPVSYTGIVSLYFSSRVDISGNAYHLIQFKASSSQASFNININNSLYTFNMSLNNVPPIPKEVFLLLVYDKNGAYKTHKWIEVHSEINGGGVMYLQARSFNSIILNTYNYSISSNDFNLAGSSTGYLIEIDHNGITKNYLTGGVRPHEKNNQDDFVSVYGQQNSYYFNSGRLNLHSWSVEPLDISRTVISSSFDIVALYTDAFSWSGIASINGGNSPFTTASIENLIPNDGNTSGGRNLIFYKLDNYKICFKGNLCFRFTTPQQGVTVPVGLEDIVFDPQPETCAEASTQAVKAAIDQQVEQAITN
ncbi:hypothetical protein KK060_24925, partial [Fulvivirgaceae bacterium PWU20]|nr:hypothetical protein [Chryseosolibacter indicus]